MLARQLPHLLTRFEIVDAYTTGGVSLFAVPGILSLWKLFDPVSSQRYLCSKLILHLLQVVEDTFDEFLSTAITGAVLPQERLETRVTGIQINLTTKTAYRTQATETRDKGDEGRRDDNGSTQYGASDRYACVSIISPYDPPQYSL